MGSRAFYSLRFLQNDEALGWNTDLDTAVGRRQLGAEIAMEATRTAVLRQIAQLGDFRPGSINLAFRRCGKSTCHCSGPKDPGHGPQFLLTYKVEGKTVSEVLPDPLELCRSERP
jgi:hypothetical protein